MKRKTLEVTNELTDQQLAAIDLLVQGVPTGKVAVNLKIDPSTVWRWRQQEPFQAERERRRLMVADAVVDRLIALLDGALDVCMQDVAEGDGGKAIAIIRALGTPILKLALEMQSSKRGSGEDEPVTGEPDFALVSGA